ncbi:MAG: deoxyribose-phosphate aldolase [Peptostreptococcaceae bacterium]|nr:deoxyribose-phosphate aldolase [Peptostreptococcaceae bacterium]
MELRKMMDHTLLKAEAKGDEIDKLCKEAAEHGFFAVCVNPYYVSRAAIELKGKDVKVAAVVGFPLGATTTAVKVCETQKAVADGADEIDMVMNIGAFKNGEYSYVEEDIKAVRISTGKDRVLKVIIETCYLDESEVKKAAELVLRGGADFVKTSTGFGPEGAKASDIIIIKSVVGENAGIKASGGIRDREKALKMIEAGATRIGASASVKIVE